MTDHSHFVDSSQREKVLEHLFVGDLLRCLWRQGMHDVEVLRAEVDRGGYDLVFECNNIIRHVQLKASYRGASTAHVGVSMHLANKPSGCVIWLWFDPDTMQFSRFLWLGDIPGKRLPPLGNKIGRHSKGDSTGRKGERPSIRIVGKSKFKVIADMDAVAEALFSRPDDKSSHPIPKAL